MSFRPVSVHCRLFHSATFFPSFQSPFLCLFSDMTPCSLTDKYLGLTDDSEILTRYLHFHHLRSQRRSKLLRNMFHFAHTSWLHIPDESSFVGTATRAWIIFILIFIVIFQSFISSIFHLCLLLYPPIPCIFLYLPSSLFPSCIYFLFPSHFAPFILRVLFPFLFFFRTSVFSRQLVNWPRYTLHSSIILHYPPGDTYSHSCATVVC